MDGVVVMRRFEQASLFDALSQTGGLSAHPMHELTHIADFHAMAERRWPAALTAIPATNQSSSPLIVSRPYAFVKGCVTIIRNYNMPRLRRLARGEEAIETRRTRSMADLIVVGIRGHNRPPLFLGRVLQKVIRLANRILSSFADPPTDPRGIK